MNATQQTISAQVVALPSIPIADLWALWDKYFPRRPANPNRRFMESRIAYKIQEKAFGGLSQETQRKLINIGMRQSKIKGRQKHADLHLAPGTVLVRECGERDHKVTVTGDGGFEYKGQIYKSLSSVARHIAGTPWSGPVFFGLRSTLKESA